MPKVVAAGPETKPVRSDSRAPPLNHRVTIQLVMNESGKGDSCRGSLGASRLEAPPCKAPVQLMCTQQFSAPHRAPLSISQSCCVGPFLSCQALLWGRKPQQPRHTQVGCVVRHWLAGLVPPLPWFAEHQSSQTLRLADAAFLEATSKSEARFQDVGFPAQDPEVPSDWELSTKSIYSPLCGMLARLFCVIQYKPLLFRVCVSQIPFPQNKIHKHHTHPHSLDSPQITPRASQIPSNTSY